METLSPQTLRYVDEIPTVKAAIVKAAKSGRLAPAVTVTLEDFDDSPVILYACLEFARHYGVSVTFVPTLQ